MYNFEAIGKQLAEKHGLVVIEKGFETDYFLIPDTSFAWSEVLRTFHHDRYIVFFNTPEKVEDYSRSNYSYCFAPYRPDEMNKHFGIDIGIAKEIPDTEDGRFILQGLKDHFTGECCEVGMYLAMGRQADREGYPEIAEAFRRYAFEEADHASRFAELLGEVVWADTKTNVEKRMLAEEGACAGKMEIAKKAKALNLDAIHDTVHEMAKDEARHGAGFQGLFNRFFKK